MKNLLLSSLGVLVLAGCTVPAPESDAPEDGTALPEESIETASPPPEINTFSFDEIELAGCGMSLWAEGSNPREEGVYFFNGLPDSGTSDAPEATMRMKIDGEILSFERTEGSGEEFYGQYEFQSFAGPADETTVTVVAEQKTEGPDPEVSSVEGTITVNRNGNEATVEAVGNAGC